MSLSGDTTELIAVLLIVIVISLNLIIFRMCSIGKEKNGKFWKRMAILELIVSIIAIIVAYSIGAGLIHPPEKTPKMNAIYSIERTNMTQTYVLSVVNNGSIFADRVRIQVGFPNNTTITHFDFWPPQTWEWEEGYGGVGDNFSHVIFKEVAVNETVKVTLTLTNDDFQKNKTLVIEPEYQNVYSREEAKIDVTKNI